ncbi:hypothetical protein RhiirC2_798845 [Rhizophagus irregularis]|uniref:Uncharacterized protein n=1 Tax=Rhizophagus irregularis TaxID=588596 RepID=A0A2N1M5T4_9GLOM|nr:hypothetical protein RhiirC2_798845 [Rhizophagus irregularis]
MLFQLKYYNMRWILNIHAAQIILGCHNYNLGCHNSFVLIQDNDSEISQKNTNTTKLDKKHKKTK